MENAVHDLLAGYVKHNLYRDYPAEIYASQIKSYIQKGFFTLEEYNTKIKVFNEKLGDIGIITRSFPNDPKLRDALIEKFEKTGLMKVHSIATTDLKSSITDRILLYVPST